MKRRLENHILDKDGTVEHGVWGGSEGTEGVLFPRRLINNPYLGIRKKLRLVDMDENPLYTYEANVFGRKKTSWFVPPEDTDETASAGSDNTFSRGDHEHELIFGDSDTPVTVDGGHALQGKHILDLAQKAYTLQSIVGTAINPLNLYLFESGNELYYYGSYGSPAKYRFIKPDSNGTTAYTQWAWRAEHSTSVRTGSSYSSIYTGYPQTGRHGSSIGADVVGWTGTRTLTKIDESGSTVYTIPNSGNEPYEIAPDVLDNYITPVSGDFGTADGITRIWSPNDTSGYAAYTIYDESGYRGVAFFKFSISTGEINGFGGWAYDTGGITNPTYKAFSIVGITDSRVLFTYNYGSTSAGAIDKYLGATNYVAGSNLWNGKDLSAIGTPNTATMTNGYPGKSGWDFYINKNNNYAYGVYRTSTDIGIYRWDLASGSNQIGGVVDGGYENIHWYTGIDYDPDSISIVGHSNEVCIRRPVNPNTYFQIDSSSLTFKGYQERRFASPRDTFCKGYPDFSSPPSPLTILPYDFQKTMVASDGYDHVLDYAPFSATSMTDDTYLDNGYAYALYVDALRYLCEQWCTLMFYDGWPASLDGPTGLYQRIISDLDDAQIPAVPTGQESWTYGPSCNGSDLSEVTYLELYYLFNFGGYSQDLISKIIGDL